MGMQFKFIEAAHRTSRELTPYPSLEKRGEKQERTVLGSNRFQQPLPRIGDQAAGIDDSLAGFGERLDWKGFAGDLIQDALRGQFELIFFLGINGGADDEPKSDIDRVLKENACEAFRDDDEIISFDR